MKCIANPKYIAIAHCSMCCSMFYPSQTLRMDQTSVKRPSFSKHHTIDASNPPIFSTCPSSMSFSTIFNQMTRIWSQYNPTGPTKPGNCWLLANHDLNGRQIITSGPQIAKCHNRTRVVMNIESLTAGRTRNSMLLSIGRKMKVVQESTWRKNRNAKAVWKLGRTHVDGCQTDGR